MAGRCRCRTRTGRAGTGSAWCEASSWSARRWRGASRGPYLLQAAIASVHAEAVSHDTTDWRRILAYYDLLVEASDTPVVRLNRAVAMLEGGDPDAALGAIDALQATLEGHHPWHATRAEVLARLGRTSQALAAFEQTIRHCDNAAVVAHLDRRVQDLSPPGP